MTLETIGRTIYERLRLAVVSAGYLPNVVGMSAAEYAAAKAAIIQSGKQIIEVLGEGAPDTRDEKKMTRITVQRRSSNGGSLGGFPATFYVPGTAPSTFKKLQMPERSRNVQYEVRLVSNTAEYDRIGDALILRALGQRRYLKCVKPDHTFETDEGFWFVRTGDADVTSTDLIERIYSFTAQDVWTEEPEVLLDDIKPMSQIGDVPIVANDPQTPQNEALPPLEPDLYLAGDNPDDFTQNATQVP